MLKIFIFIIILFCQIPSYSKSSNNSKFNSKNLANYFSAIVSTQNQDTDNSLIFFETSKSLVDRHDPFLKQYIYTLVSGGNVDRAVGQIKLNFKKKNSKFFEAYLLLIIDSIKKENISKSKKYLTKIKELKNIGQLELLIVESIDDYVYLFENNKISVKQSRFINFNKISKVFQNCYLGEDMTDVHFNSLINDYAIDYSRYLFFYINYLVNNNQFDKAKEISSQINVLNNNLLNVQAKEWIDNNKFKKFNQIFSCNNKNHLIGELFFLVANLYSVQKNYEKSNFYLSISNFLNPKFKQNLVLAIENYYVNENYSQLKKILRKFNKKDDLYYWYKIKKKTQIIAKEEDEIKSFNFINLKFNEIKKPSLKILFDMANITKNFEKFKTSIKHYNKVLLQIEDRNSNAYADVLFRRGGSHERNKNFVKSDNDLLESLKINPDNEYVLNYLAYSWLERDIKIDQAIRMLEKAYEQKQNDPFIIDSIGWAYYLTGDFIKAEEFIKRAVQLMPDDPVVNDHYGDILWKLDKKLQAKYFWKSVLSFDETEDEMKIQLKSKILFGLEVI
jgi:tetratricopeptide (TPR) repeat protein